MSKFKVMLLSGVALVGLMCLAPTANAQLPQAVVQQLTPKYSKRGPLYVCRDPWITIAINEQYGATGKINGVGEFGECNQMLYNGGTWSSYAELYQAVKQAFQSERSAGLVITKQELGNGNYKITTSISGKPDFTANQIISHDGGTLITSDGAGILTNNGGTFISDNGSALRSVLSVNGNEAKVKLGRSILVLRKR